jgi:hypothetical protein
MRTMCCHILLLQVRVLSELRPEHGDTKKVRKAVFPWLPDQEIACHQEQALGRIVPKGFGLLYKSWGYFG